MATTTTDRMAVRVRAVWRQTTVVVRRLAARVRDGLEQRLGRPPGGPGFVTHDRGGESR